MNSYQGNIIDIQTSGNLSIVTVRVNENIDLSAIIIDTPESVSYLTRGNPIHLLFKETEVVISTSENPGISMQNKIAGTIRKIEEGQLLTRVVIQSDIGELTAIISTDAVKRLDLSENRVVYAFVKLNEVMLAP